MRKKIYDAERISEDKLLKDIIDDVWILTLLREIGKPIAKVVRSLNTELIGEIKVWEKKLKQSYTIADLIYECEDDAGRSVIVHIEIQRSIDKRMSDRMSTYSSGISRLYPGMHIYQVLLYTGVRELKADEHLEGMIDLSTVELRRRFSVGEMMSKFGSSRGCIVAFYCASNAKEFDYLVELLLVELYRLYDDILLRSSSYSYFYNIICILLVELNGSGLSSSRREMIGLCIEKIRDRFTRYCDKEMDDIIVINNPYVSALKDRAIRKGKAEGKREGGLSVLRMMVHTNKIKLEDCRDYLKELGLDEIEIARFLEATKKD